MLLQNFIVKVEGGGHNERKWGGGGERGTDLHVVLESCHQFPGFKLRWEVTDLYHMTVHCQTKQRSIPFQATGHTGE